MNNEAVFDAMQLAKMIDGFYQDEEKSKNKNLDSVWQWKYYQQAQDRWLAVPKAIADWQRTYYATDWVSMTYGLHRDSIERWLAEQK